MTVAGPAPLRHIARMEVVLFTGVQGSGKSSYFKEHFYNTHVRINRDMLKTKNREWRLIQTCLEIDQPFVVDNTNVTRAERAVYIEAAKAKGCKIVGYFFEVTTRQAIARNSERAGAAKVPIVGILGTYKRLQPPTMDEGYDELFTIKLDAERS